MVTYEAENVVLKMTDKTYKNISANYDDVIGRMAAPKLNCYFDRVARLLSLKNEKTFNGGEYYFRIYGSGCGYPRRCKFKKKDAVMAAIVKKTANGKFSVSVASFIRVELKTGEYLSDVVMTSGALTRAMHVAKFIGRRDYENPCWIKGVHTLSYDENKKAAKRVWERFCDNIFDFEI